MIEAAHARAAQHTGLAHRFEDALFEHASRLPVEPVADGPRMKRHAFQLEIEADTLSAAALRGGFARGGAHRARVRRREGKQLSERGNAVRIKAGSISECAREGCYGRVLRGKSRRVG